jgi:catalase
VHFINESFNHCKTIGASGAGVDLLQASALGAAILQREGVVVAETADRMVGEFATALAQHRHWSRERGAPVPA